MQSTEGPCTCIQVCVVGQGCGVTPAQAALEGCRTSSEMFWVTVVMMCLYHNCMSGTEAVRSPAKLCELSIACLLLHFGAAYWISTQQIFQSFRYFWCSYFPLYVYHTLYSFSSSLQACRLPGFLSHSRELFSKVFSSSL